jgi:hypothetical protein
VATLLNNVLGRRVETVDDLLGDMRTWIDNASPSVWYYLAIQEATNSHFYEWKVDEDEEETGFESWTEMRENPDWAILQKVGAQPGDLMY